KSFAGAWMLDATDARGGTITPTETAASVLIKENAAGLLVHMGEVWTLYPPSFRATTHEHTGDFGLGNAWSGSDRPFRFDGLWSPKTSGFLKNGATVRV